MNKLWHDPVWSKVISSVILAAAGVASYRLNLWQIISQFFTVEILAVAIIVAVIAGLAGYFVATWRMKKLSRENEGVSSATKFDEVFEPKDSIKFYAQIADFYDKRNSAELLQTHRVVVTELKRRIDSSVEVWVLDLGGGTGSFVAHHFFDDKKVKWVYVDACGRMAEKFRENLSNVQLRTDVHVMSLTEACDRFSPGKSKVILMSFLISSLPERPDFSKIAHLLTDDGILIIAEADPAYSGIKPYYSFATESASIALKINPIHHLELKTLCEDGGLREVAVYPVTKRDVIYSYVAVFQNDRPSNKLPPT